MTTIGSDASADFQRSTRMPLDAVVRLHFEGTVAYQNGFAANVSATGMFVKHPDPPAIGTRLVFEFAIGSQRKPAQGAGEVVWVREKYEGPGRPAGAGIRFAELDELSKQNITEALFEFLEASLGDRVSDNLEARALVASRPTHASLADFAPEPEAVPLPAPAPEPVFAAVDTQALPALEPRDGAGGATPFRIFDEEPAPVVLLAPPAAPPVEMPETPSQPVVWAGAAVARAPEGGLRRWLLPVTLALALAAAGFGAWWFWLRSPAAPAAPAVAASAAAPPSAPRPASPPLGAELGPGRTLADAVAPTPSAPGTPLPAGGVSPEDAEAVAAAGQEEAASPAPPPPAARAAPAAAPSPAPAAARATTVSGIAAAASGAGTLVTLSGDGVFATGAFSWSEIGGDKPRVLIKLRGMTQPFRGGARGVPTPEVQGVRTGYHPQPGGAEIHVVIDLVPGARVEVESVEPGAGGLLVTLRRR